MTHDSPPIAPVSDAALRKALERIANAEHETVMCDPFGSCRIARAALEATPAAPADGGVRTLCERVYRHGFSDGWRSNQRGKLSAPVAADEEWGFYVSDGALRKSLDATLTPPIPEPASPSAMREAWKTGIDVPRVEDRHRSAAAWAMDKVPDSLTWEHATASHVSPDRLWQMNRVAEAMARVERQALMRTPPAAASGDAGSPGTVVEDRDKLRSSLSDTSDLIGRLRDDASLMKSRWSDCKRINDKSGMSLASQIADDCDEAAHVMWLVKDVLTSKGDK